MKSALRGLPDVIDRMISSMSTASSSSSRRALGALVAVVYVSEGRNERILSQLARTAVESCAEHGTKTINVFRDAEYNRTGFTLGMRIPSRPSSQEESVERLRQSALALTERALSLVDLRKHVAHHPRCGVVDHISCHGIGHVPDDAAAVQLARSLGERIGGDLHVPVLLYGNASEAGTQLAELRRRYGYFKETATSSSGRWAGEHSVGGGEVSADYGPRIVPPEAGVVMLGATPWIYNYNVPIAVNISSREETERAGIAARRLARKVSERGGGLPKVQAMALSHGNHGDDNIVEIACNLLDVSVTAPCAVQQAVERLCAEEDATFSVKEGYATNLTPEEMLVRL